MGVGDWKPVFISESLAVSRMPPYWAVEGIEFDTVVSLATPYEHSFYGYDPRLLEALGKRFHWFSIPEYNAPKLSTLVLLVSTVEEEIGKGLRVLVHSRRGCGRLAVFTASWVMRTRLEGFSASLAETGRLLSCNIETRPQRGVLKAFNTLLRLKGGVERLRSAKAEWSEEIEATTEYALLLAYELYWLVEPPSVFAELETSALWRLGRAFYEAFGYRVADVDTVSRKPLRLEVHIWVPRETHPMYFSQLRGGSGDALALELSEELRSATGIEDVEVVVKNYEATRVPFVAST